MKALLVAAALVVAVIAMPLAAALPPCTCDPNPITDLLRCSLSDGSSTPPPGCEDAWPETPSAPETPDVKELVEELDPRNWPCTCDPGPVLM